MSIGRDPSLGSFSHHPRACGEAGIKQESLLAVMLA